MFHKALSKKITRKEFLKFSSLILLGGLIGGFFKVFSNKKEKNNSFGNDVYGGIRP